LLIYYALLAFGEGFQRVILNPAKTGGILLRFPNGLFSPKAAMLGADNKSETALSNVSYYANSGNDYK
jgi:hypothetical protein